MVIDPSSYDMCKFWKAGECRHHSPSDMGFPITKPDDLCGDFEHGEAWWTELQKSPRIVRNEAGEQVGTVQFENLPPYEQTR